MRIAVVGAGVFGLTGALELRRRGHTVVLFEPGEIPRAEAASNDLSRAVRMDYGADAFYVELGKAAIAAWERPEWGSGVYAGHGFLLVSRSSLTAGTFEGDGHAVLTERGEPVQRLAGGELARRFPALAAAGYIDGYLNPRGGQVDAGQLMRRLGARIGPAGIEQRRVAVTSLCEVEREGFDRIVVAAGAWTPTLLPELADRLRPTGQPVCYFEVGDRADLRPPSLVPFGADIARTGWYAFPAQNGVLKVANHGPGLARSPDAPRDVPPADVERARAFVTTIWPELADAPLADAKVCFYCDSFDGDFWIAAHPERAGVVVASGGSGHAFKFAPLLGGWVADAVEGRSDPALARFGWRQVGAARREGARRR